jgi:hypothetical protein
MDGPRGIGRAVNEKERFSRTAVLFYGLIGVVDGPVILHLTLNRLCIEVCGDFLHKTPLGYLWDAGKCA